MRWLFTTPARIDHAKVVEAIQAAEKKSTGEIRVVLARHRTRDPIASARKHFVRLGMDHTRDRNAVLIFVAPRSRNFAVIGDQAVHEKCGDPFWAALAQAMTVDFQKGDFTAGIVHAITEAGSLLAAHFPRSPGAPKHELPHEIEEA